MSQEEHNSSEIKLDLPESAMMSDNNKAVTHKVTKKRKSKTVFIVTLLIIIVLVVAAFLVNKYTPINLFGTNSSPNVEFANNYSAVFLSNGQVYFGVISYPKNDKLGDSNYIILKDIYYLQVSSPLQQAPPNGVKQEPKLTLVKLGTELHAPEDYMQINSRQIIFIEKLKSDGQVVQAIEKYKKGEGNQNVKPSATK